MLYTVLRQTCPRAFSLTIFQSGEGPGDEVESYLRSGSRGRGVLPETLGGGVRPASQNPYPIYDQNLRYSLPYL